MVARSDREYFRRVAAALGAGELPIRARSLQDVADALARLSAMAKNLGHVPQDPSARAEESSSHLSIYGRRRGEQRAP